jgi:ferredoxin
MRKLAFLLGWLLSYSCVSRQRHYASFPEKLMLRPAFNPASAMSKGSRATQHSVAHGRQEKKRFILSGSWPPELKPSASRMKGKPVMVQTKLEPFIKQIMEIQAKALGPTHPGTLKSKSLYAKELQAREDWKGAEKLQREVLKARLQQLGLMDEHTLTAQSDLARSVLALGDVAEAEKLCLEALEARTEMLGSEHQDTLTSKHDLAEIMWARDDKLNALQLHNETYAARLSTLGLTHSDTLTSAGSFADILDSLGKENIAKKLRAELMLQDFLKSMGDANSMEKPKDTEIASHMQLDFDEDGLPTVQRFVFVDEPKCIGCTNCAVEARNTFFMEEGAGRARAFAQGQDDQDAVEVAIACCPTDCIKYVDLEDLIILETERSAAQPINPKSIGTTGGRDPGLTSSLPTKAKIDKPWEAPPKRKETSEEEIEEQAQAILNEVFGIYSDDDSISASDANAAAAAESKQHSVDKYIDQMKSIFEDSDMSADPVEPAHALSDTLPSREEFAALFATLEEDNLD